MTKPDGPSADGEDRRQLLGTASRLAMLAGLAGGYGALGFIAARFLYPAAPVDRRWLFVADAGRVRQGDSLRYRTPGGATVNVTRQRDTGAADDFIALSSVCPHLGCQVHWEPQNGRYFCPCHNGTFDPSGVGTGGPPGDAGQTLSRYPLKLERGLLYIEVPVTSLAEATGEGEILEGGGGVCGPGHDPCLAAARDGGPLRRPGKA